MWFSKPAWMSKNVQKAVKAVEEMFDQELIHEIVGNRLVINEARKAAIRRVTDQDVLFPIINGFDDDLRTAALEKASQYTIKRVLDFYGTHIAKVIASSYLRDRMRAKNFLFEIMLDTNNAEVFTRAIEALKTECNVSEREIGDRVGSMLILSDKKLGEYYVGVKAGFKIFAGITDDSVIRAMLAHIAKSNVSESTRKLATTLLYDKYGDCIHIFRFGAEQHTNRGGESISHGTCQICGKTTTRHGWDDGW